MTDRVQAKQDLEFCYVKIAKYQNLSRSSLKHHQMRGIDQVIIKLKERIRNLMSVLDC